MAGLLAFVMSGCLFAPGDSSGKSREPLSDEGWIPVVPQLPPGWPSIQWPDDNPFTPAKAILGRRLFFETKLSRDGTISCFWCHAPGAAFTDRHTGTVSLGIGNQPMRRNTPTLVNVAFGDAFLFDGSVASLEEQALHPLFAPDEMDMTAPEIEARLAADTFHVRLFRQAYGDGPVTIEGVAKALATYQRTLISHRTPWDRWVAGDHDALSPAAQRGAALFMGAKANCVQCHSPPLFTDGGFHNIGLDTLYADPGRAEATGNPSDAGKFKTPTLRNISVTEPYMHDGRFWFLEEVLEHYNAGGAPHPNASPHMRPLGLDGYEIHDLAAFLRALEDPWILSEEVP